MRSSANIRKIQLVQLEILDEFDRICKKYNINYFFVAGTVLGAVRHKGFIPWDDDIDVGMVRQEYERFLKICSQELDECYFLQTYLTDPQYPNMFAKIRKNGTTFIERTVVRLNMHHGIYIDIFPFDNIPDSKFEQIIHKTLLTIFGAIRLSCTPELCNNSRSRVRRLIKWFLYPISKIIPKKLLDSLENRVAQMFNDKDTAYIGSIYGTSILNYDTSKMPRDYIFPTCELEFENNVYPAPGKWHEYLQHLYNDYMVIPPADKQISHHVFVSDPERPYNEYIAQYRMNINS